MKLAPTLAAFLSRAAEHTGDDPGVMIAWMLPPELSASLALPDGEPPDQLHCTMAYLGRLSAVGFRGVLSAHSTLEGIARTLPPMAGQIGGVGRFAGGPNTGGKDVAWAAVDVVGLERARTAIVDALTAAGVGAEASHGWTPHVTLQYLDPADQMPLDRVAPTPIRMDSLSLCIGGDRFDFPLTGSAVAAVVVPAGPVASTAAAPEANPSGQTGPDNPLEQFPLPDVEGNPSGQLPDDVRAAHVLMGGLWRSLDAQPGAFAARAMRSSFETRTREATSEDRRQVAMAMEAIGIQGAGTGIVIPYRIATNKRARDGHIIELSAWRGAALDPYRQNPLVLWMHDRDLPPIGRAAVWLDEADALWGAAEYVSRDVSEFGGMIGEMAAAGFLHKPSISWQTLVARRDTDQQAIARYGYPMVISSAVMLEFSNVTVESDTATTVGRARAAGIDVGPMVTMAGLVLDGVSQGLGRSQAEQVWRALAPRRTITLPTGSIARSVITRCLARPQPGRSLLQELMMPIPPTTNRHQHAAGQRCVTCNQRTDPGLQPPLIDGPGGKGEAPQGKPAPGQGTRLSMEQLPQDLIAAFQTVIDYATGVKVLPSTGAPTAPTPPVEGQAALPPVPPQPEEEPNAPQPPPMDSDPLPKDDEAARARANRAAAEQINRKLGY